MVHNNTAGFSLFFGEVGWKDGSNGAKSDWEYKLLKEGCDLYI